MSDWARRISGFFDRLYGPLALIACDTSRQLSSKGESDDSPPTYDFMMPSPPQPSEFMSSVNFSRWS